MTADLKKGLSYTFYHMNPTSVLLKHLCDIHATSSSPFFWLSEINVCIVHVLRDCNRNGNSVIHWASRLNQAVLLEHLVGKELQNMRDDEYSHDDQEPVLDKPDLIRASSPVFQARSAECIAILLRMGSENKVNMSQYRHRDSQPLLHYCIEAPDEAADFSR